MKLGEILLRKQLIAESSLEILLKYPSSDRQPLGERLLAEGLISKQQLNEALQEQFWRRNGFWLLK
jgi:hypothetical protein